MPDIIIKKRGILPPDEHGAEALGLLDEAREEKERVNKNDPRRNPRKPKEWGMPFDKKDNPGSKGFMPVEKLPDINASDTGAFNPVEEEIVEKIDKKAQVVKLRLAQKLLKFIETIEPLVKDKDMLKQYTQSPDRINPQGRWEASEEEISRINEFILKSGLNSRFNLKSSDLLKEFTQMSPDDLAKVKQNIMKFIEDNPLDDE